MLVPYNRHNDDDYDGGLVVILTDTFMVKKEKERTWVVNHYW